MYFFSVVAAATVFALLPMLCLVLAQQEAPSLGSLTRAVVPLSVASGFYSFYRALRLYVFEIIQANGQAPSNRLLRRAAATWLLFLATTSAIAALVARLLLWIPGFPGDVSFRLVIGLVTATILAAFFFPEILRRMAPSRALAPGPLLRGVRALSLEAELRKPRVLILEKGELPQAPNAFVAGPTARTCTVFLTETLAENFEQEEVLAVVAHEIGHAKLGHLKRFAGASVVSILFAWAAGTALPGLPDNLRPVVQSFAYLFVCGIACRWMMRRAEFEADRFGAELVGSPQALIRALQQLELTDSNPERGERSASLTKRLAALFRTHPSTEDRIAALKQLSDAP